MVRTLFRSALREIRRSMGRYLAILAIVGLGVGFFAGLRACQPDMIATGTRYLEEQKLYDFRLLSTLGFTQEDVDFFAAEAGVAARGAVFTDFLTEIEEGTQVVVKAHSLTDGMNLPKLTVGRMPETPGECLGDEKYFLEEDLGKVLPVSADNDEDTRELLRCDGYTVVGLAWFPYYLNYERGTTSLGSGSVAAVVYIPEGGFDFEAYHEIFLTMEDMGKAYSDGYDQRREQLEPEMETLLDERAKARYESLYGDAMEEIADAEQEIADGWSDYYREKADAENELEDAYRELTDGEADYEQGRADYEQGQADYEQGRRDLADGQRKVEDAQRELEAAEQEVADGERELDDARRELDDGWADYRQAQADADRQLNAVYQNLTEGEREYQMGLAQLEQLLQGLPGDQSGIGMGRDELAAAQQALEDSRRELDGGWAAYSAARAEADRELAEAEQKLTGGEAEYDTGVRELEDGRQKLEDARRELEDARRELEDARRKLDDARDELDRAPGELADARRELDDGWAEYHDGRADADKEFADAERELRDAEQELADAREKLEDLKPATTYVLTREENTGYACFENDTSIVAAVSVVFPVFFFLVAALVCMTTMTRMVDEQRTQIGVLKALGYGNGQIMAKYLFYSGSAALVGSLLGYELGVVGLPWVIWEIYGMIYGFAPLEKALLPKLAAVSFASALLCSIGATWLACRMELNRQASELIRPKTPRAGRRVFLEYITPLWRRLSFLHKVSARNVLRYRSRLVMMVLGIGGCTALLCTGFGIRDSIAHVADDQFDEITLYDYAVAFHDGQTPASAEAYLKSYGWSADEGLLVHSGSVDVLAESGVKSAYLVSSSTGSLEGFLSLHSGGEAVDYPGPGEVVLNSGLAESLGLAPGDSVRLRDGDLGEMEAVVSAVCDNYVFNYAYVSAETYRRQLGEEPEYNALYVLAHEGADLYQEGAALLEDEDVSAVTVNAATRSRVDSMLSRMDYIVVVVVLCAAALAFIVLYNLTNINVTERIREIATIKVLGFHQNEVAAYVFREISILSVLGSVAGLGMGKALHTFVMAQIKIDSMTFVSRISWPSYLISFAMTMVFTLVISLGMRPRLRRIDMAESLKSIE